MAKREADKATEVFRKAVKVAPKDPGLLYLLGLGLSVQGQLQEAGKKFEEALALKPDYLDPLVGLVRLAYGQRKPEAALGRVKQQLKLAPNSGPLHHLLGTTHLARGHNDAAEKAFLQAINLKANHLRSYLVLGTLYARTQRYDKALAKLEQALSVNPKDIRTHMLIGVIHHKRGATPRAQASYEKALELNPRFGPAANNLAYIYTERGGNLQKALALARTAKEQLPASSHVSDTLGWIFYKHGVYERALLLIRESLPRLSDNPEVQYHLGMAHYQLGNSEAAKQALAQALKLSPLFPGFEEAKRTLAKLE